MNKTVLITGASGFVGRAVVNRLLMSGWRVRALTRSVPLETRSPGLEWVRVDMLACEDWLPIVTGCHAIVHLAARVHVMRDVREEAVVWGEYRSANVDVTDRLARAAIQAGIERFVFMSSVKVNGEGRDEPYDESDVPSPSDAYGRSKYLAEQALTSLAAGTQMQAIVLRPPLVYGPGVRANFRGLLRLSLSGLPLPFGCIQNRRSLIFVENLADAVAVTLGIDRAPSQVYLVSDGEDFSTPELVRAIAAAGDKPARLFSVPTVCLKGVLSLLGRAGMFDRLAGSLSVDSTRIRQELDWTPPYSSQEGLKKTIATYLSDSSSK